ncbi:MAG: cell shape-determining protein MreB [Cytophagales bacterium]|nr:MAG: cell shape-determining protein MreB [Cytophagales bacterium]
MLRLFARISCFVVAGLVLLLWLTHCKPQDLPAPPTILSVSPVSAPVGASLVITGSNFSTNPADNLVRFGDKQAVVIAATPTQLTIIIPAEAGLSLTVSVKGATSNAYNLPHILLNTLDVSGEIRANTTFTSSNIYLLRGFVYVTNGATLTIEPGTVIKGGTLSQDPLGQNRAAVLIVEPGAKLIANGTAQRPIVFTSSKPAGQRNYGDWGGIVLIGKAPHNRPATMQFGFGIRGTFGAFNEPSDNSGSLQYVRIEFAGGAGLCCSEFNALSLYGVGSGTVLNYVQVSYSGDDSVEWFGGTVNARHLVSFRTFDDDFDLDWGYTGKVQFALALRDPEVADNSGSNCIESDNFDPGEIGTPEPNKGLPLTRSIFANVSSFAFASTPPGYLQNAPKGSGPFQAALHIRRNSASSVINSLFVGWPEGLRLEGASTWQNAMNGSLEIQGTVLANVGTSTTTAVRGGTSLTNEQVQTYFLSSNRQNQLVPLSGLSTLLLSPATFNLTSPAFLLQTGSPLLQGGIADGKLTDPFFTPTTYRGAFGSTDWTLGWTNWTPQTTNYDR